MQNTIVLGLLRGDEGKGKIVDYLSDSHDIIIRFQGGPNAGHTIYRNDKKCVLHQIPSGILNKKECLIGHGCIVDPKKLVNEIEFLLNEFDYINPLYIKTYLKIAKGAHVIFPKHIDEDTKRENSGKGNGSTKCGISPCYRDKYYRTGKRLIDLFVKDNEEIKLNTIQLFNINSEQYDFICSLLIDDTAYLNYQCQDKNLLFEGAQGVFLDIDNPYYPNVSSSHVSVGGVITGTGINFKHLFKHCNVVGIVKSYMSSVGVGEFLTEIKDKITLANGITYESEVLRSIGGEFGATTGRPRKVGFLDLPMIKYACDIIGVTDLCLTRLDTLFDYVNAQYNANSNTNEIIYDGPKYFPVCVNYAKISENGELTIDENIDWNNLQDYKPIYKMFKLWTNIDDNDFQTFIKYIEKYINIPVTYISVGKNKADLLIRKDSAEIIQPETVIIREENIKSI